MYQDLSSFKLPQNFRGRPAWLVQLWWLTQAVFFRNSPQFAYSFRSSLLRMFGAKIGRNTVIRPSVTITYPWKVEIGDYAWIGDNATLYSLGQIRIGEHSVVSQNCYLCAGDHDYADTAFTIRAHEITVERECWIAADCYIGPGVKIGAGSVIGARSSVFKSLDGGMVYAGSPAERKKNRISK